MDDATRLQAGTVAWNGASSGGRLLLFSRAFSASCFALLCGALADTVRIVCFRWCVQIWFTRCLSPTTLHKDSLYKKIDVVR